MDSFEDIILIVNLGGYNDIPVVLWMENVFIFGCSAKY